MKVLKFGGTSVQFPKNMIEVKNIISDYSNQDILIVLSACRGTTDNLLALADASSKADNLLMKKYFEIIKSHHIDLINNLNMEDEYTNKALLDINSLLSEIENLSEGIALLKELTYRTRASIVSYGELLSTCIFSYFLKSQSINNILLDARKILKLFYNNNNTFVDFENSGNNIRNEFNKNLKSNFNVHIIQGFIGSDEMGHTAVLSRGGSDYSAAVFGAELNANEIQIWTDVSGIYSADPRYFPNAIIIDKMTFSAVKELSAFGAKVLHPDTVKPAIDANIPVRVLNTNSPKENGTLLVNKIDNSKQELDSVAIIQNLNLYSIAIHSDKVQSEKYKISDIYYKLSECINNSNSKYFLVSQSISQIQIITDDISNLYNSFNKNFNCQIKEKVSAICIVGKHLRNNSKKHLLDKLAQIIFKFKIELLEFINNDAVYLIIPNNESADDVYKELHNFIIKSKNK